MKKAIIITFLIVSAVFALRVLVLFNGFYIDLPSKEEPEAEFYCKDKAICRKDGSRVILKGVNVDNFIPGHKLSDYAVDKETWLKWFAMIADMGANCIKAGNIYDSTFYDALYEFNTEGTDPLYLLQGIHAPDDINGGPKDAVRGGFCDKMIDLARTAVDVVHGKRNIATNKYSGNGTFTRDVSPWVVGYIAGSELDAGMIAYTNHGHNPTEYRGAYLYTEDADAFEAAVCRIMDELVSYEADKYQKKRLISASLDATNDPFVYEEGYDLMFGKYVAVDLSHIKQRHYRGLFAAYDMYELCKDYRTALNARTKERFTDMSVCDGGHYLNGYVSLLNQHHDIPVLVSAYGASTARGVTQNAAPMNEEQQAKALAGDYTAIINDGACGAFVECWQDSWTRRDYNTSFALERQQGQTWKDPQTASQARGILAFIPENPYGRVKIDGSFSDFSDAPDIIETGDVRIKYSYDMNYLYLYAAGDGLKEGRACIAFDITPKSGSTSCGSLPGVSFSAPADFILSMGPEKTELLVQERYDASREIFWDALTGEDPFLNPPAKDTANFETVWMICQPLFDVTAGEDINEVLERKTASKYYTGILREGNEEEDSLADCAYGTGGMEVRIPWTLLNFYDISSHHVHADYYENYGVEGLRIDSIQIGAGFGGQIQMVPFKLPDMNTVPKYAEETKAAYEELKRIWN